MDSNTLHIKYLQQGTAGFVVIRKFYLRYADLLVSSNLATIDDVMHEIFLSLSKTDFNEVRNAEHYIMRAIKLQCWSMLDKAIKHKTAGVKRESQDDETEHELIHAAANQHDQLNVVEGNDLLVQINLFKARLNPQEVTLLNHLIDETDRFDIAAAMNMNLNTLDTNIRRLRMKLAEYLKHLGYVHAGMERFG